MRSQEEEGGSRDSAPGDRSSHSSAASVKPIFFMLGYCMERRDPRGESMDMGRRNGIWLPLAGDCYGTVHGVRKD